MQWNDTITREFAYIDGETGRAIRAAAKAVGATVKALPVRRTIGRQNITVKFYSDWKSPPARDTLAKFNALLEASAPNAWDYNYHPTHR